MCQQTVLVQGLACCLSLSLSLSLSLFKLHQRINRLTLPEARHPEDVGKIDDLNYYLYHRMLGHPTKSCYIFKDVLQVPIDAKVLKLHPEQKKVTTNLTAMTPLQFGRGLPPASTEVFPIPKGELRVIIADPHHQEEKVLVSVPTP